MGVKINGRNLVIVTVLAVAGILGLKLLTEKLPVPQPVKDIARSV